MTEPQHLIIGGVYKAATTSLYQYLADHPQVFPSHVKETRFFLDLDYPVPSPHRFPEGLATYERFFAGSPEGMLRMESTPFYLFSPGTAARIHQTLGPRTRMVFVLRDPIARLYSSYGYRRQRDGAGTLSFADYVAELQADLERGGSPQANQLAMGRYSAYLAHYLELFSPERVHVMVFRDLTTTPLAAMRRVCAFAGIDEAFYDHYTFDVHNATVRYRHSAITHTSRLVDEIRPAFWRAVGSRPWLHRPLRIFKRWLMVRLQGLLVQDPGLMEIAPETARLLTDYYRDDVQQLSRLLGRTLPWEPWLPDATEEQPRPASARNGRPVLSLQDRLAPRAEPRGLVPRQEDRRP